MKILPLVIHEACHPISDTLLLDRRSGKLAVQGYVDGSMVDFVVILQSDGSN